MCHCETHIVVFISVQQVAMFLFRLEFVHSAAAQKVIRPSNPDVTNA